MDTVDQNKKYIMCVDCCGNQIDYSDEISSLEKMAVTEECIDSFKNIILDARRN